MGRSPCCDESAGLKKGPWTPEEDQKLIDYITKNGLGSWRSLPKLAGLNRCGKSCRLRWTNYLRPDIKRGKFSEEEERIIINLHSVLGNKWAFFFLLIVSFILKLNCLINESFSKYLNSYQKIYSFYNSNDITYNYVNIYTCTVRTWPKKI